MNDLTSAILAVLMGMSPIGAAQAQGYGPRYDDQYPPGRGGKIYPPSGPRQTDVPKSGGRYGSGSSDIPKQYPQLPSYREMPEELPIDPRYRGR